ncbi:ABC transporter permease [Sporomusa aerivorans]|uniref:ABC transporter permease n=1 Tax=Sporomusa aerivorans TaxID=204936 RepID=UPI00352B28FB
MLALIWKSVCHRKLQNAALVFSVAAGVAILFCMAAIYHGVDRGMELSRQRMGADLVVIYGGARLDPSLYLFGGATDNSYLPADMLEAVRAVSGVVRATPQFFTQKLSADCHDIGTKNRMIGYDPDSDWIIGPWLKKVSKNGLDNQEVILGAKVPTWQQNRISILGKWYDIVAIAEETGTTLDYSLLVSMEEARRVAAANPRMQAAWQQYGAPEGWISAVLVQVEPEANLDEIVDRIQQNGYVKTIVAADVKSRIQDQFAVLGVLLGGAGALTGLVSLFQLFARFYALTWERQAEWGLYLALGASGRSIAVLIIGEAVMVASTGSVAGLMLGGILYHVGLIVLEAYQAFPFVPASWMVLGSLGLALTGSFTGLSALAAWLPAYEGSQMDPSTIISRGECD